MMFGLGRKSHEVFGISTEILEDSYVNRGSIDELAERLIKRSTHIALRGESKCGKSWVRQKNFPDAITVQCRLNKCVTDLYEDALSQLGLKLIVEQTGEKGFRGKLEAHQEIGVKLLAKLELAQEVEGEQKSGTKSIPVGRDLKDLRFVADIIKASGRRLVIEDFHYLAPAERKAFAFDLKALWDLQTYVVVIGIWAENNLLLWLNPDLAGRIEEISIYWSKDELEAVLTKGADALNIEFSPAIRAKMVEDAFGTVGILQAIALKTLDEHGIFERKLSKQSAADISKYEYAAATYAEQLNPLYQTFAQRVAKGIRTRKDATGIYAHMLKVVMDADSADLTRGLHIDAIFARAHQNEPRIQKGNLRQILTKIDSLQIDDDGRGLILTFDHGKNEVFVVDKQLLTYRKYCTVHWPWASLIEQSDQSGGGYDADQE
ncbi:hypothetical protein [Novosphingobium sp. SG720]|uniref:hypothetical protein n=1 Tax=Novosphingobium sp. SG720 TaxID=2586998 RepID=UPI001448079E|nr:hypothetical protein [Novosphingobium sp. SG720]